MRILLIQPPPRRLEHEDLVAPPLGLAYLASVAEGAGYEVAILDAFAEGLNWDQFERRVRQARADVIGLGGMTPVIDSTFTAATIARKYCDLLVLGGPHVSAVRGTVFDECPEADYAIAGEGEDPFLMFLDRMQSGESVDAIPGLLSRDIENPRAEARLDQDSYPFPARHLLPTQCYHYPTLGGGVATTMFTSRGCPYNCTFCDRTVFGNRWRARSPENVVQELEEITRRYGIGSVIIYDDLFTVNRERVIAICRLILERGVTVRWKAEGRCDQVSPEMLKWMKRAGCEMIAYGVETATPHGLEYLDKKETPEHMRNAFKWTRDAGIQALGYFILGIPVETFDDELETIEFAKELGASFAQFSIMSPTPGTPLWNDAIQNGWYRELEDAVNPMDKDKRRPVVVTEEWTEEKLRAILHLAHRRFYFRPRYIWEQLTSVRSMTELAARASGAMRLVRWTTTNPSAH